MRKILKVLSFLFLFLFFTLFLLRSSRTVDDQRRPLLELFQLLSGLKNPSTPSDGKPFEPATTSPNPFGVMPGGKNIDAALKLGVSYYRPISVFLDRVGDSCPECDAASNQGLKLVLTIRNNGRSQVPTTPPSDLTVFKNKLSQVIDRYNPELVVVENEENSEALFYAGSPEAYHTELKAACEVAHQKGIKCTNGGLVSALVALLVAQDYQDQGQEAKAQEFLERTLGQRLEQQGLGDPSTMLSNPKAQSQIVKGRKLLAGYKAAGADFINFHWYIPDTDALSETVAYLEKATGLSAMTNEIGQQKNESPEQVTAVLEKVADLSLPYAIWFSIDIPAFGGARGLVDSNGNLRPNGEAFRNFMEANY